MSKNSIPINVKSDNIYLSPIGDVSLQTGEILEDKSSNGKKRPWNKHKRQAELLAESYERLGNDKKAIRLCECGGNLIFYECPNGHERKLKTASFCRIRLCPMCCWRRSLVNFAHVSRITHEAMNRQELKFIFLTLTYGRVKGNELADTLTLLFNSWNRLCKRKAFNDIVVGWIRALEVTYDYNKGTYHPHFHVLIGVKPSYFKSRNYINQEQWIELWQKSLKVDFRPIVDVRTVKPKYPAQKVEGAVAETVKYATKPEDYLIPESKSKTDEAVSVLDSALANRRLIAYGGLFKEIRKELQLVDAEDADLVHVDEDGTSKGCKCSICQSNFIEHLYRWNVGFKNYIG